MRSDPKFFVGPLPSHKLRGIRGWTMTEKESPAFRFGTPRYWLNLGLFALGGVFLVVWFRLHLLPWFARSLMVAGGISVWAIVLLARDLFWGSAEGAHKQTIFRSLIQSPRTTYLFGLFLFCSIFLLVTTSSIYITLGKPSDGSNPQKVDVLHAGRPYTSPIEVNAQRPLAGRPFFFELGGPELEFRLAIPAYQVERRRLLPWTAVHLTVPDDFKPKPYRVVRLVPGFELTKDLPAEAVPGSPYTLTITIAEESPLVVSPYVIQSVFLGASAEEVRWVVRNTPDSTLQDPLDVYLSGYVNRPEVRNRLQTYWKTNPRFIDSPDLQKVPAITVEVKDSGDTLLSRDRYEIEAGAGIQTIILPRS